MKKSNKSKEIGIDSYFSSGIKEKVKVEPIRITKEWLLKSGFNEAQPDYFLLYSGNHAFEFIELPGGSISELMYSIKSNEIWNEEVHPIKYVHEFNKFYFDKTGEELQAK